MTESNPPDVFAAFEMLLDEIASEIAHVNQNGAGAFQAGDYDRARLALERAGQMKALRARVSDLQGEWQILVTAAVEAAAGGLAGHADRPPTPDRISAVPARGPAAAPPTLTTPSSPGSVIRRTPMRSERSNLGRAARGVRTHEEEYYLPILRALVELGGRGRVRDVIERVKRAMHDVLVEADYEPLASNPRMLHWSHNTHWARDHMVQDGRLKQGSPYGIWEISEAGRAYLAKHNNGAT